jgi:hypothetical protein
VFLASENIDFTGLSHVFLLGGGERGLLFIFSSARCREKSSAPAETQKGSSPFGLPLTRPRGRKRRTVRRAAI